MERQKSAQKNELSVDEKIAAEYLLISFFDAQVEGDTKTIEKLLGGHLLKKRKKLLNNPSYKEFLRRTYKSARLQIISYKKLRKNSIQVDTVMIMDQQESIHINFILVKESVSSNSSLSYRIHSERIIKR